MDHLLTKAISNNAVPSFIEILIWPGARLYGWQGMLYFWPAIMYYYNGFTKGMIPFLLSAAIGQSINRFGKQLFQRDRPVPPSPLPKRHFYVKVPSKKGSGDGPSFPSGDSMAAGVVGTSLYFFTNNPYYLLLIAWGMVGRVYYHCHYFFDTLVGASVGLSSTWLTFYIQSLRDRDTEEDEDEGFSMLEFGFFAICFVVWMKASKIVAKTLRNAIGL